MTMQALDIQGLWFSYIPDRWILRGVSLSLPAGSICMILGPSGSGKSTLLKTITGILRPSKGLVRVNAGGDGRRIAYIPQTLGLVRNMTALENTLIGALGRTPTLPSLIKMFSAEDVCEAKRILAMLRIPQKADEPVYNLSGGERQRVAIARALMQRPLLVLADEFVSHLDPLTTREIMQCVAEIANRGVGFLITSHEVDLVARFGNSAVFLKRGEIVHECPASEVNLHSTLRLMSL
ncbi:MAG: ATP-binding cassette domain-containing protein [Acidobacteria bacterium]|nr:ATP-binding cassette domain-containing protein [Acidobacteriota bacterium]